MIKAKACFDYPGNNCKYGSDGSGHIWRLMNIDGSEYIFDPQIEDNLTNGYHSASEGGDAASQTVVRELKRSFIIN